MSSRFSLIALASMALMMASIQVSSMSNSSKDEDAIRQIVQQLQDGWNAYDGKAFAAPFAENADYVVVNGQRHEAHRQRSHREGSQRDIHYRLQGES
jgi:hypothetical protein